ncbi:uncharacterized protein LOC135992511 isoform X1 [Caloenas nicobarica]|uniref:uncharacterized protein LOC135992511 isoform X1 n=1 Tax=Caloenas nicobarica TaxID=187106 RepID=UPI0032B7F67A
MAEAAGLAGMAAMAEARLRRKQLLSAEEAELFELAQAAGSGLDPDVFRVLLDLLRMNVAPLAVFQVLKSMCAGQRLPPGPEGGPAAALPADTRGGKIECLTPSSTYGAVVLRVFVVRAVHGLRTCRHMSERGGRSPIEMSWIAKSIMGEIKPILQAGARFLPKGAAARDLLSGCLGSRARTGCRKQELLERAAEGAAVPKQGLGTDLF